MLLASVRLIFCALNLTAIIQILRGTTVSYHHAVVVWEHVTMWNLSLILGPMNHLRWSINWLSLSFRAALPIWTTNFTTSWSLRLINLIVLAMVRSWSCNSLTRWTWNSMSCQSFSIHRPNMTMWRLFWCRSRSTWACILISTLLFSCAIWSMITSRSHSTWATIVFTISSFRWFALIIWTQSALLAQAVIIATDLRSLFLYQLLIITWRVSSSVKLLLISELLLLRWKLLRSILLLLSVWRLLGCSGARSLLSGSIATCCCSNWCSVVAWTTLLLNELWSIRILYHTLISLVHTDIGWENTVIKVLLLCGIQRVWYLILWCNSWCWLTSLGLRNVLTCQFMQLVVIMISALLWVQLSSLTCSEILIILLHRFDSCATASWMWLSIIIFHITAFSSIHKIIHFRRRHLRQIIILGALWMHIQSLHLWSFFIINRVFHRTRLFCRWNVWNIGLLSRYICHQSFVLNLPLLILFFRLT